MDTGKQNFLYDNVLPPLERLYWLLFVLGLALRYFLFSTGDTLLIIGLGGLATVYFLLAFAPVAELIGTEYEPFGATLPSPLRKPQYIASAIILVGVLFKLLFWNGAAILLLVGTSTVIAVAVWQVEVNDLSRRTVILAVIGLTAWAIPTDVMVRHLYRDDPALVEKMIFQDHHPHDRAATAEVLRLLSIRRRH